MSSRFGGGKVVPIRVARQLLKQRDQLLEEVQKTRRERDRLQAEKRNAEVECETLERRVEAMQSELQELREGFAEGDKRARRDGEDSDGSAASSHDSQEVAALQRRVERLTGDLERIRRRTADEISQARREERVRLLSGLGQVLDAVDRALAFGDDDGPWRQGLEAIQSQLMAFFRGEGASVVGEVGEEVDPRIHQAIDRVEAPALESGQVARVDRVGIVLEDGTVVRTAQVAVARR